MGLSSKQVVSGVGDVVSDWSHLQPRPPPTKAQQQQAVAAATPQKRPAAAAAADPAAPPALRCPRCDSANTKFCYYNNYSRSQPRYLCKACKRHWTSGGTLRNVPVGGSRKTKRPRTASSAAATNASTSNAGNNASSPSSNSLLLQTPPGAVHGGMDGVVQAPLMPYSSLLDVPELDYLNGGGIHTSTGVSAGSGVNLAQLLSLPPLSLPFSTAALGSFLDLASCSGGDAPLSHIQSVPAFFPFIGQPEASTGAAASVNGNPSEPFNNASSAWNTSGAGHMLPTFADVDSSSPYVLSPAPFTAGAAVSCGGMMSASWVDDFAGIISTMQQPHDYHLL